MDWNTVSDAVRKELTTIPGYDKLGSKEMKSAMDSYIADMIVILQKIAENPENAKKYKRDMDILRNRFQGMKQIAIAKTERYLLNLIMSKIPETIITTAIRKIIL